MKNVAATNLQFGQLMSKQNEFLNETTNDYFNYQASRMFSKRFFDLWPHFGVLWRFYGLFSVINASLVPLHSSMGNKKPLDEYASANELLLVKLVI